VSNLRQDGEQILTEGENVSEWQENAKKKTVSESFCKFWTLLDLHT